MVASLEEDDKISDKRFFASTRCGGAKKKKPRLSRPSSAPSLFLSQEVCSRCTLAFNTIHRITITTSAAQDRGINRLAMDNLHPAKLAFLLGLDLTTRFKVVRIAEFGIAIGGVDGCRHLR